MASSTQTTLSPRTGFIYALAFLVLMGGCFAIPRMLSFLPAVWGIAGILHIKHSAKVFPPFDEQLALFFALLVAFAGASSVWAPDTAYAFERSIKIAALLFPALAVLAVSKVMPLNMLRKDHLPAIAVAITAFAALMVFFEYYSRFTLTRAFLGMPVEDMPENMRNGYVLNRSTVLLTLSSLPVALMVLTSSLQKTRKYFYLAVLFLSVGACLCVTDSQTAQIAGLFAVLMVFYPAHRKKARIALLGVVLALMASAPFLIKPVYNALFASVQVENLKNISQLSEMDMFLLNASVPHRLEVWKFASEKTMDHPLIGNGVDSLRFLKAGYIMENMGKDSVMHPHNAVLQIWVEFGALGISLMMALVFVLFQRICKQPPLLQRYYTALFVVFLSVLSTGYGLWQAWLVQMVIAITAMSIMAVRINSKA